METGTGPGAVDTRPSWRRTALYAAPWLVAAVLVVLHVLTSAGREPATSLGSAPGGDAAATPAPTPTGTDESSPTATPAATAEHASAPATAQLSAPTRLAVLATAREALGRVVVTDDTAATSPWPVDARIVDIETVTSTHAVATVHGLVLEHRGDGWHGPLPRAVAVLVRTASPASVIEPAWPLPPPTSSSTAPDVRPVEDPDPALVQALQDAGWTVEEVLAVVATEDGLLRLELRGTAPPEQEPRDHVVWLLDAPGGPRPLPLKQTTPQDTQ